MTQGLIDRLRSSKQDGGGDFTAGTNAGLELAIAIVREHHVFSCKHPEDCDYPDCGTRAFPDLQKCDGTYAQDKLQPTEAQIERVARSMAKVTRNESWEECNAKAYFLELAKAAIAAITEIGDA